MVFFFFLLLLLHQYHHLRDNQKTKNKGRLEWSKQNVEAEENLLFAMLLPVVDRVEAVDEKDLYNSEFYGRHEERGRLYRQVREGEDRGSSRKRNIRLV